MIEEIKEKSKIDELIEMVNNEKGGDWSYEDKKDFIIDKINEFRLAIEQNQPKVHLMTGENEYENKRLQYCHKSGKKAGTFKSNRHRTDFERMYHWNESSRLDEWLIAVMDEAKLKLIQIEEKKKNSSIIITTPFQQQLVEPLQDELKDLSPEETQRFDKVYYDYLEWHLHRQLETIKDFLSEKFILKADEYIQNTTKSEIVKIVMEAGDKIHEVSQKIQKINQAKAKKEKENGK